MNDGYSVWQRYGACANKTLLQNIYCNKLGLIFFKVCFQDIRKPNPEGMNAVEVKRFYRVIH